MLARAWATRAAVAEADDEVGAFWESEYGEGSVGITDALRDAFFCALCVEFALVLLVGLPLLAALLVCGAVSRVRP